MVSVQRVAGFFCSSQQPLASSARSLSTHCSVPLTRHSLPLSLPLAHRYFSPYPGAFAHQERLYICPFSLKYFKRRGRYRAHCSRSSLCQPQHPATLRRCFTLRRHAAAAAAAAAARCTLRRRRRRCPLPPCPPLHLPLTFTLSTLPPSRSYIKHLSSLHGPKQRCPPGLQVYRAPHQASRPRAWRCTCRSRPSSPSTRSTAAPQKSIASACACSPSSSSTTR